MARRWAFASLSRPAQAYIVAVEAVIGLALVYTMCGSGGHTTAAGGAAAAFRTAVICALACGYAVAVERVSVVRRYLHLGARDTVWTTQSSLWTFAAVLTVPLPWALLVVLLVEGQHLFRGWRTRSGRAYRDVFGIFTTSLGVLAATVVGDVATPLTGHSPSGSSLAGSLLVAAQLAAYTLTSLVAAVGGIRLYGRSPSLRQALPPRRAVGAELGTLVLAVIAAQIIVHSPWWSFAVPVMAAVLWRSTLVTELTVAAQTDAKTGLLNAAAWRTRAEEQLALATRASVPASVLLLDLDRFKVLNDRQGHLAGDRALVTVADSLRAALRTFDVVGRFGGEEFAIILPATDATAALTAADRVRETVLADTARAGVEVTASIGISDSRPGAGLDDLLRLADAALYRAKDTGRNRCVLATDLQVVARAS